jgi:hypothetical protein
MVARISIQFATKSSIVTIASLLRMLSAKHMGTMNAVEAVNRLASAVLRARSQQDCGGADQTDRGDRRRWTNQQYPADLLDEGQGTPT